MKYVRGLAYEPPLLKQYRDQYPTEQQRPPNEATATWDGFRSEAAAYGELLNTLAETQQGLCMYCEQRLVDGAGKLVPNDYQVEHVQAKSRVVGRVLDWLNLALVCGGGTYRHHSDPSRVYSSAHNTSCGQTKGDAELPTGGDTRQHPLVDALVEVGLDGSLLINPLHCAAAGIAHEDVGDAIRLLNLNCERLRKGRQDIADNTRSWFVFMLEELLSPQLTTAQQEAFIELLVARRLQPDVHKCLPRFWTAERSAIGAPAEPWLAANRRQFA